MRTHDRSTNIESLERMLEVAMSNRGGSYHQRTVGNCFGHGLEFFCAGEHLRGVDGRTSAFKCNIVGIYHPEMPKSKVAHRPCRSTYVKGIARVDQDDAQLIEFRSDGHAVFILRQEHAPDTHSKPLAVGSSDRVVQM